MAIKIWRVKLKREMSHRAYYCAPLDLFTQLLDYFLRSNKSNINQLGLKILSWTVADLEVRPTRYFFPQWVKIVHNVCGLPCILGLKGPNNQVSLTIKKRRAYAMVPSYSGRKGTKSPHWKKWKRVAREISLEAPVHQTGASLNFARGFFFSFEKPPAN